MQAVSVRMRQVVLGCLSAVVLGAAPALAQTAAPSAPAQTQPQAQPSDISDQKLDATAAALEKVTTVKRSYEQKISAASAADQKRLTEEANGELAKAVTEQGLSVEEYNSIIQVAQNDPQLRQKILQRVKAK